MILKKEKKLKEKKRKERKRKEKKRRKRKKHGGISKIFLIDHFSPSFYARNANISPIFHFDQVNNGPICRILQCVLSLKLHKYVLRSRICT